MGQFVGIRMIILKTGEDRRKFEAWMTDDEGFLDKMGELFMPGGWLHQVGSCPGLEEDHGLEGIIFLRGIKENGLSVAPPYPLQSHQHATRRDRSSEAGANADYAWITFWTDRAANKAAWSCQDRPETWYAVAPDGTKTGLWMDFREKCFPRTENSSIAIPEHGPAYDYVGSETQRGAGAGCLVEGFEVIYTWPPPPQASQSSA